MKRLAWERCERENAANGVGQDREDTPTGSARARALPAGWPHKPGPCGLWLFKWKLGHPPPTPLSLALQRSSLSLSTGRGAYCTRETRSHQSHAHMRASTNGTSDTPMPRV